MTSDPVTSDPVSGHPVTSDPVTRPPGATVTPISLRLRSAVNWANLSTAAGVLLAKVAADGPRSWNPSNAGIRDWADTQRLILVKGYRPRLPAAAAFCVGNVIVFSARVDPDRIVAAHPQLLAHEARHCTQYAWCTGPGLWALYPIACAWSYVMTGDLFAGNPFERRAGLVSGGYPTRDELPMPPLMRVANDLRRRRSARRRRSRAISSGSTASASG